MAMPTARQVRPIRNRAPTAPSIATRPPRRQAPLDRWIVALVGLLLIGHCAAVWSARWPAAATSGGPLVAVTSPPAPAAVLKVGTFNIHAGKGADGELDLSRTAAALRELNCDFVGLNEVSACSVWSRDNQAQVLGEELVQNAVFAAAERRYARDWYGNGFVTRYPVLHWESHPLPATQERGHRAMIIAELPFEGAVLHVLVTHIDRRGDRQAQLQLVKNRFLELPKPALLLGDLNSSAADPVLRQLLAAEDVVDPLANAGLEGENRIDWILARGLKGVGGGQQNTGASDHAAYWAELKLP